MGGYDKKSANVDMKRRDEHRDIRRFFEALIAAGVGAKKGCKTRYKRVFLSYTEKDCRSVESVGNR